MKKSKIVNEYIEIDNLNVGDVLCYYEKGVMPFLFRLFTNKKYTQLALITIKSKNKIIIVHESLRCGYIALLLEYVLKKAKKIIVKRPKINIDKLKLLEVINEIREYKNNYPINTANVYILYKGFNIQYYKNFYEITPDIVVNDFINFETFILKF